jgi:hypothetical protein
MLRHPRLDLPYSPGDDALHRLRELHDWRLPALRLILGKDRCVNDRQPNHASDRKEHDSPHFTIGIASDLAAIGYARLFSNAVT